LKRKHKTCEYIEDKERKKILEIYKELCKLGGKSYYSSFEKDVLGKIPAVPEPVPGPAPDVTPEPTLKISSSSMFCSSYKEAVERWAATYAPKSDGIEYGCTIYHLKVLERDFYFTGETYKGFNTKNWHTVINGLGAGNLTGAGMKIVVNRFSPITKLNIIGFAHTHPVKSRNGTEPSEPDKLMKRIGFFVGQKVFPIAHYKDGRVSVDYF